VTDETGATKGSWDADLELLISAAKEAGDTAMSYFGQSPETWWKNEGRSPVTAADYAANDVLIHRLRGARPDYGWLSEETEDDGSRRNFETLFVIDPIDGTRGFMNGLKTWCVSAAVVHQGRPVAGVLVAPALDEVFAATENGPALKNGKPAKVLKPDERRPFAIASSHEAFSRLPNDFQEKARRVEHIPSLAYRLAMIADGSIDATLVKPHSHDWDLAAADLILNRAGGQLSTLDGKPIAYNSEKISHGVLCAAHETAMKALLKAVSGVYGH
jgi:myo-inositol-1(or 4)-monophosphatase